MHVLLLFYIYIIFDNTDIIQYIYLFSIFIYLQ